MGNDERKTNVVAQPESAVNGEPWFLPDYRDCGSAAENRGRLVWRNQRRRHHDKFEFYKRAFDFITDNEITGDYLEFGCHRARTFRMAINEALHHSLMTTRFIAFDSFCGMPDDISSVPLNRWARGNLVTSEDDFKQLVATTGIDQSRVITCPGYFANSLSPTLARDLSAKSVTAAIVCIDCDLYESAKPIFKFLPSFLQEGTVVYIDDYYTGYKGNPSKGVAGAFNEFQAVETNWAFNEYLTIGAFGKSFIAYMRR
jgi:O-methyltransferase